MRLLKKLFRKNDLEIPELPELPRKRGKLPAYPTEAHTEDLRNVMDSVKKLELDVKELYSVRKDIDVFKKMKLVDFDKMKKQLEEKDDLRKEMEILQKSILDIQDEKKNKKANALKDMQLQLTELEAELALLQESHNTERIKEELLPFIQAKVVQHVFESKYDPREIKSMKKQVLSYIERAIDAGHSEEKVKHALHEKGWPEELVAAYYGSVSEEKLRK